MVTSAGRWSVLALLGLVSVAAGQPTPPTPPASAPSPNPKMPASADTIAGDKPTWPKEIGGKDVKGWLAELKESPDAAVREQSVKILPQFGPGIRKDVLEPLMAAYRRESDPGVKSNIIIVLGNVQPEATADAKKIVDMMKLIVVNSPAGGVQRLHAVRALTSMAHFAVEAVPELKGAVEDPSWEIRLAVATALGVIGRAADEKKPQYKMALDILTGRLKSEKSAVVRSEIVQALLVIGPPTQVKEASEYAKLIEPHWKAIVEQSKVEKEKSIQVWLMMLMMLYDGAQLNDANIRKVAEHIQGTDANARTAALRALAMLDDRAKPFVPAIVDALKIPEPGIQAEALVALAGLKIHARDALPAIEQFKTATKDEFLQDLAARTVDAIHGKKSATPPVKK